MTPTQHRSAILRAPDLAALDAAAAAAAEADKLTHGEIDNLTTYAKALLTGPREPIGKAAVRWLQAATLGEWGYSFAVDLNYAAVQTLTRRGKHLITCNRYIMFAVAVPDSIEPGLYALDPARGEIARADLDPVNYPNMDQTYRGREDYANEPLTVTEAGVQGATKVYRLSNGQLIACKHLDAACRLRGHGPIQPIGMAGHITRPIYLDAADQRATAMVMPIHPSRT